MNTLYDITVRIDGHAMVEDPKCPSRWKGSGCYDVEAPGWCLVSLYVSAETEARARYLASQHDFDIDEFVDIDDVTVVECKSTRPADEEEIGVEVYHVSPVTWREDDCL